MQLSTHNHAHILLALFSHMTFSLLPRKPTTNNQAINDSVDYSEDIFIFLLHTRGNARRILLVVIKHVVSGRLFPLRLS